MLARAGGSVAQRGLDRGDAARGHAELPHAQLREADRRLRVARQLAARGLGVTVVARREDRLRVLADSLASSFGVRAEVVAVDLADPASNSNKTASKARGLEHLLGHPVDGPLHIDYVPDLGDAKTAWDHVSFEGFLGARMSLQFTWSGYDSALAAPLVLDLARLAAHAHRTGRVGVVPELGFFFKDPAGSGEHRLASQWDALTDWCARIGERP
jgi:hypothetical protein